MTRMLTKGKLKMGKVSKNYYKPVSQPTSEILKGD